MSVTVVVGGQYGSEGKGKMVSYLAATERRAVAVVRSGGPNAGHTADGPLGRMVLRQLPSGTPTPRCGLFLAAGMQLQVDLLLAELAAAPGAADRLMVDRNAIIVDVSDVETERELSLGDRLSSTLTGTGAAQARRLMRDPSLRRAADVPELARWTGNVSQALNSRIDAGARVIVEGTQGFGLSLLHAEHHPYTTSRDTTAAAFLSEAGLAPTLVDEVVLVLRTFPIRVGGPSGPIRHETTWERIRRGANYPRPLEEFTTVTGKLRRVADFDWELATHAVAANRPTAIALHGVDYLDFRDWGVTSWDALGRRSRAFVDELEDQLGVAVEWVFTGPEPGQLVDRRADIAGAPPPQEQPPFAHEHRRPSSQASSG